MAIAHVCLSCGTDLARCRLVADPHYGLPLVRCPGCGEMSVRRRHPIVSRGRAARRTVGAIVSLLARIAVSLALFAATVGGAIGLQYLLLENWNDPGFRNAVRYILLALGGLVGPIVTGVWLTAGFSHLRRPMVWGTWCALAVIVITIVFGIVAAQYFESSLNDDFDLRRDVLESIQFQTFVLMPWVQSLIAMMVLMTIAMLGIPAGRLLVRASDLRRRLVWRRTRRVRRGRRASVGGMKGW